MAFVDTCLSVDLKAGCGARATADHLPPAITFWKPSRASIVCSSTKLVTLAHKLSGSGADLLFDLAKTECPRNSPTDRVRNGAAPVLHRPGANPRSIPGNTMTTTDDKVRKTGETGRTGRRWVIHAI